MKTEHEQFYAALASRDPRFDGRFFSGITTTGVYCRPVCPARTPAPKNVRFYRSAAEAEAAGFRACLRCRPEAAPGAPAWTGTAATVTRALRLIRAQGMPAGLPGLADRVGVGPRHLRRLFQQHLGASPLQIAHSMQLDTTRLLLVETRLPMHEVAHRAGFKSVRRFNAVVARAYGRTPTELRASGGRPSETLTLKLAYRPPFAWDPLLSFLGGRAPARLERVRDGRWQRVVGEPGAAGVISVRHAPERAAVIAEIPVGLASSLSRWVRMIRRVFDLDADPAAIEAVLSRSPRLAPTVRQLPGLRIPGAPDGLELAIRTILGQQISVVAANTLFGRLVERWGRPVETGVEGLDRLFPTPETLRDAALEEVGVTAARARAIRELSAAAADDDLDLGPRASLEAWVAALCQRRGIGPWTAHYLAMRAAGEADAFPSSDLGLRRAGREEPASEQQLLAEAEAWRPWRAYAAITLWNHRSEP
jgi:AraC family transcriptional regulator of adaptative response / DNA-3-methyladenine glycosylase II